MITFENRDCMEAMKEFPDKFFDLAIVDPPYGDGVRTDTEGCSSHQSPTEQSTQGRFGGRFDRYREQCYCMNHKCVEFGFGKLKTDGCEAWEDDDEAITEKR